MLMHFQTGEHQKHQQNDDSEGRSGDGLRKAEHQTPQQKHYFERRKDDSYAHSDGRAPKNSRKITDLSMEEATVMHSRRAEHRKPEQNHCFEFGKDDSYAHWKGERQKPWQNRDFEHGRGDSYTFPESRTPKIRAKSLVRGQKIDSAEFRMFRVVEGGTPLSVFVQLGFWVQTMFFPELGSA